VAFDEPLSRHTSLQVGGPADAFARPGSIAELQALRQLCRAHGLSVQVLGQGFNTLVRDGGIRGLVVHLGRLRALEWLDGAVRAEAGVTHSALTRGCVEHARAGLEFGIGIPGCIGGWIRMNAGTREREMKDVVESVTLLDGVDSVRDVTASALAWRYREVDLPADSLVLAARLRTEPGDSAQIRTIQTDQLARRRSTQPIHERSCGSVFKNPAGDHAGRLIEAAGLKGEHSRSGGAEISSMHANFIVTRGRARAADVLELIERAREAVAQRFGVELETEVQIVGEQP
jgi:UDP-N-acetylmuramate dehydrogenase